MTLQVRLGPDDEKSLILMKSKETAVIDIATVEDIEAARLGDEVVEDPHVVRFSICDLDKRGDRTSQIEKGMELDGGFVVAENSPREKGQAQVDHRRIEGIDGVFELDSQIFAGVKSPGLGDEDLGEVGIDAPIASFVGMSQSISGDSSTKSHVIESALHGPKAGLDIAETFAIRQLSEGQTKELIETREALDLVVAVITTNTLSEFVEGEEVHNLRKDGRRGIHRSLLAVAGQKSDNNTKMRPNRLRPGTGLSYVKCGSLIISSFQRWDTTDSRE